MLLFDVKIPVKDILTKKIFVELCKDWIKNSPHYNGFELNYSLQKDDYEQSFEDNISCKIMNCEENPLNAIAFRIKNINQSLHWTLDLALIQEKEQRFVVVQNHCAGKDLISTVHSSYKPVFIDKIVSMGYCSDENYLKISDKPIICDNKHCYNISSYITAPSMLNLPLVYVSRHYKYKSLPIDCDILAKRLSGLAYVVIEDEDDTVSQKMKHLTKGNVAFGGFIGVYFPGTTKRTIIKTHMQPQEILIREIFKTIRIHSVNSAETVWDYIFRTKTEVMSARITSDIELLQQDSMDFKEYVEAANETETVLREQVKMLTKQNESLKAQLDRYKYTNEKHEGKEFEIKLNASLAEFYPGERKDMILSILQQVGERMDSSDEINSRRYELLSDLIINNEPVGECERIMTELKQMLYSGFKWNDSVKSQLEGLGFSIQKNGHYKLIFNDNKYCFIAGSTPSDVRGGKNLYNIIDRAINVTRKIK